MMTKLDDYIILKVKEKRIALGWSQQELANNINRDLSPSFIAKCENPHCRAKYNINHISDIAKAMGCRMYDFLPEYPVD
jgi:ribosome-binding protein aMBF1 (putative translation factor)